MQTKTRRSGGSGMKLGMGIVVKLFALIGFVFALLWGINAIKPGGLDSNKETFY